MIEKDDVLKQFESYYEQIFSNIPINNNPWKSKEKKTFLQLYILWNISKRPELKRWLNDEYYIVAISFLLQSFTCLTLNQASGALLLIRSSLENFVKFGLSVAGETIDRNLFKNNISKFRKKWASSPILISSIDRIPDTYRKLSKIAHSATTSEIDMAEYLGRSFDITENDFTNTNNYITKIIEIYMVVIFYICRDSFKYWDGNDLKKLLQIGFNNKITENLIEISKKSK